MKIQKSKTKLTLNAEDIAALEHVQKIMETAYEYCDDDYDDDNELCSACDTVERLLNDGFDELEIERESQSNPVDKVTLGSIKNLCRDAHICLCVEQKNEKYDKLYGYDVSEDGYDDYIVKDISVDGNYDADGTLVFVVAEP